MTNNNRRLGPNGENIGPIQPQNMRVYQMRQELVLTAARHDAALAYQLLAATKPPASTQPVTADARGPRPQINSEDNLEQILLGRIASLDPKLAAQNAEQMMDKGQFPTTLPQVINQLYKQDPDAADKLADKTVKKIQAANILSKTETGALVQGMLRVGPRPASSGKNETASVTNSSWPAVLGQSAYVDLLSTVVDAALKATPPTINNPRGGGPGNGRGGNNVPQPMTDAQIEQNNARRLLAGLQQLLPMVDQYLPTKAALVRQKFSEMGLANQPVNIAQTFSGLQANATTDSLLQAAATAPQQIQSRLYQQAAYKALEEGDTDRARQIANDHLTNNVRDTVMQRIDFRELAKKAEGARLDEIRLSVSRLAGPPFPRRRSGPRRSPGTEGRPRRWRRAACRAIVRATRRKPPRPIRAHRFRRIGLQGIDAGLRRWGRSAWSPRTAWPPVPAPVGLPPRSATGRPEISRGTA